MLRQKTSNGIKIEVETSFRGSSGKKNQFKCVFDYKINIQNLNPFPVQVVGRYWFIFASNLKISEINGEGVVGQTPKLKPNEVFTYSSCSFLTSEMGYMEGYYQIMNLENNSVFDADIPRFELIADWKLN